jgi:hypothetical protein
MRYVTREQESDQTDHDEDPDDREDQRPQAFE